MKRQTVARQNASGNVVQVDQIAESSNDFPGRVLPQNAERAVEAQGQLMNRRVSRKGWRIDAISGKGVKHEISF